MQSNEFSCKITAHNRFNHCTWLCNIWFQNVNWRIISTNGCLHYMILSGGLCHTLQIMQCKLPYYTVMHDFGIMHNKSWGIELVLFAMTKSCHFSQSTCRSLRLMSFQEKQEQGYTCSIHVITLKVQKMPRSAKEKAEIGLSIPSWILWRQFWIPWRQFLYQWMASAISGATAYPRSCPYPGQSPV